MSDPYSFTPVTRTPSPRIYYRNSPYLAPTYNQQYSPFVPPMALNASPFSASASLPPVEPTMMMASQAPSHYSPFVPGVPFPSSSSHSAIDDDDPFRYARQRTTSWTGGRVPVNAQNTAWLNPRRPQRQRSRSAGYFDKPQVVNINNGYWVSPSPSAGPGTPRSHHSQLPTQSQLALHPYLDGHNFRADILFDLMAPNFAPMRLLPNNQTILITNEELSQPATHPPIYNIKIVNDLLPSWPIDLTWNPSSASYPAVAPPLKLGDILSAIYNSLQMCISQTYWASLPPAQAHAAARTYTTRCRFMGAMESAIAMQGVKRIDFLNGQRWFKGLVRTSNPNVLKFIAA